ncbi:MAG: hypothetical protein CVV44_10130 [Spirochaetae bacterium HGW-Spirochaetae-1]|jgi:hypothetical protein|nr:MAG: hypothetical protein CVV44_10130 [Spirochaetae bacterium HGW-Spirochaetae-1]
MKGTIELSGNSLKIKSSRISLVVFTIIGGLMFLGGLTIMGKIHPVDHILFSFGILFTAAGLFALLNSRYYKMSIDGEKGFIGILDSSLKAITPLRIPLDYYSWITVQKKMGSGSTGFEVHLMNELGASVLLALFNDRNGAMNFARDLQSLMGVDLLLDHEPYSRIRAGMKKSTTTIESCGIEGLDIKVTVDGAATTFSWKSRYRFYHYILMASILYGFFHIIHFLIIPIQDIDTLKYFLYGLIVFMMILLVLMFLTQILGRHVLTIGPRGVSYYLNILGKWLRYQEISRGDIGMVKNSLNMSDDTLNIISKKGLDTMVRLSSEMKDGDNELSLSRASDIFSLQKEIIMIDSSALNIAERFCIEQKIMNIL